MRQFVGWSPTIVGRVAFSRVGDSLRDHPDMCNLTARDDGFLFGAEKQTSPDGPLPPWVMRRFRRRPDQLFAIFLEVAPSLLPTNGGDDVVLHTDTRGCLEGELYFYSKSPLSKKHGVDGVLENIGAKAASARAPRASDSERREKFEASRQQAADLFELLKDASLRGEQTPAFARASVKIDRTGRCDIITRDVDLYTTKGAKIAHRSGPGSQIWEESDSGFERTAAFIARHAFNLVRSLSHKHYHHHHRADLLATTYRWTPGDDQTWRRETLYGLTRMAIDIRRRGTAKSFKQCAGVVAYAEAFQTHLGSWSLDERGSVTAAPTVPPYDFAALKSSVDASLKVRELKDADRRQSILYLTTVFLSSLALVVASARSLGIKPEGDFWLLLQVAAKYPFPTIILATVLFWFVDLAFLRAALPLPTARTFYYGLKRFTFAAMGSLVQKGMSARSSYFSALTLLMLLVMLAMLLSFWLMYIAYSQFSM